MARWPVCVELPPGLGAELASWPDDPEILHDAIERLRAARSALARELGAGVRARRGDAAERAAWSSLLERAPEARSADRAGARAAGVASTRAPLSPGVDAEDAAASSDAERRRSDSAAPTRTPRDSSGGTYRRLASSQLRGMYSLSASAEFRAAEAAARSAGERVERSVSDADNVADDDAGEKSPPGEGNIATRFVADTPVAETRQRRERSSSFFPTRCLAADSLGATAVDAVPFVSPETRETTGDAATEKKISKDGTTRALNALETTDLVVNSSSLTRRFRFRDVQDVSALSIAVDKSASDTDVGFNSTRVFLCAATKATKADGWRAESLHGDERGELACFLLRAKPAHGGNGDAAAALSAPPEGSGEEIFETVARRVSIPKTRDSRDTSSRFESAVAFGDAPKTPWVAVAAPDPAREKKEKDEDVQSFGVRVFALDGEFNSPGAFLEAPFAPTRLAASLRGEWLVACGTRGVSKLWRGDDVREALRRSAGRNAEKAPLDSSSENDTVSPCFLLAAPRYGGVAPCGEKPDVLAFADDGKTLFAAHDGALFATWTLTKDEDADSETREIARNSHSWRPRGVSYSTRETVCDGAAHVFGEASDEETEREDDKGAFGSKGFAFKSNFARKGDDKPSLLVALARAKPGDDALFDASDTPMFTPKTRLAVGLLDHTAGRGEAHRGAVFGGAENNDKNSFFSTGDACGDLETRRDSKRFGSGFEPVALAGARGGYAAVVGADGAAYVWDVVTGETLDKWYVDADADEELRGETKNLRVAVASGFVQTEYAHLFVAAAFESGDDVVVETRRVRLPAEDTRADPGSARAKRRRVS